MGRRATALALHRRHAGDAQRQRASEGGVLRSRRSPPHDARRLCCLDTAHPDGARRVPHATVTTQSVPSHLFTPCNEEVELCVTHQVAPPYGGANFTMTSGERWEKCSFTPTAWATGPTGSTASTKKSMTSTPRGGASS